LERLVGEVVSIGPLKNRSTIEFNGSIRRVSIKNDVDTDRERLGPHGWAENRRGGMQKQQNHQMVFSGHDQIGQVFISAEVSAKMLVPNLRKKKLCHYE
jgi:hypothetical protein